MLEEQSKSGPIAVIVEDEENLALLFAEAVRKAGFEVYVAYNNIQAYANLKALAPQLVVLDLHLGGSNGVDILTFIRETSALAPTRVIVASADERTVRLVEDRADLALVKPVGFSQLSDLASRFKPETHIPHAA